MTTDTNRSSSGAAAAGVPVLMTGASGHLGPLLLRTLHARGARIRALSRDPAQARARLGELPGVDWVKGSFEDRGSLDAALSGIGRVILLSPITPTLAQQQGALVDAARAAGVSRIVKLSGSDWTIEPAGSSLAGTAHAQVEAQLAASGIPWASVRPNAWLQNFVGTMLERSSQGLPVSGSQGESGVSYVDTRDIADVLVQLLLGAELPTAPVVLTGPRAYTGPELAAIATQYSGRPIAWEPLTLAQNQAKLATTGVSEFLQTVRGQFAVRVREGGAQVVTDNVNRWLGRPARSLEALLDERRATATPAAEATA